MKKIYKMALVLMVAMLAVFGPNVLPAQTATTITAEAASTSVKQLTVGKSYTISGYAKVKSSKTSIATSTKKSSKKYTIKAKKKGTATLKCYNASGKLVKTVYLIATNSSSFKYDTSAITLTKGKTKTVKATVQSGCTVKYSSSKTSVATVSSKGKITAKKAGTATISAKVYYKGKLIKTMKKKVTVKTSSSSSSSSASSTSGSSGSSSSVPTLSVSFDTGAVTISPGKTVTAKATVTDGYTVSYSSSDKSVATVSSSGVITGVSGGTATITVKVSYNGTVKETKTKKVTVRTYQLSATSLTVERNSTSTLKCATSAGEYSSSDTFEWSSSNTDVATVSGSTYAAKVKGIVMGSATITCKVNGVVTLTCNVTVPYKYRVSQGDTTVAGGGYASFNVWCKNASDVVTFQLSNDCAQLTEVEEPTVGYDQINKTTGYCTTGHICGRKQCDQCQLKIYVNGSLLTTINIKVTSTDTYYYDYIDWKAKLKAELWTNSMSDLRKIIEFCDYVFGTQEYSSNHSEYGYAQSSGGSCWAAAYLIVDLAHDLGYEAEVYSPYYEWLAKGVETAYSPTHYCARLWINGVEYEMEATNNSTVKLGYCRTWKEGILIYDPSAGSNYSTKPD